MVQNRGRTVEQWTEMLASLGEALTHPLPAAVMAPATKTSDPTRWPAGRARKDTRMRSLFSPVLALTVALAAPALAASYRLGAIEVSQPWSRPAAKGQTGVGYMTLTNTGAAPATLVRIETAVAARAELHQSLMTGGVMSMKALPAGLVVPAGGKVELAPAGIHIMLVGLKQKLELGQKVSLTLVFKDGARLQIQLPVQDKADPMAGMSGM
ncbi:MAG: hypothetical protein JWM33_2251 [Caulobacteraceae bacterium]|nr:hypothetical protein [Caulobacteraceae bacterium]